MGIAVKCLHDDTRKFCIARVLFVISRLFPMYAGRPSEGFVARGVFHRHRAFAVALLLPHLSIEGGKTSPVAMKNVCMPVWPH